VSPSDKQPTQPDDSTRQADESDAFAAHDADRPPSPAEEAIADEAAAGVDPSVAEHFKEMDELGANVKGEGRIES
jgi:hypothetical protein